MKNEVEIRPAVRADFVRFVGRPPPERWGGMAANIGKLVVGVGGVCLWEDGRWWAFLDAAPVARTPARFHRTALRYLRSLDIEELFVACDERFDKASAWLERLGFKETNEEMNGCKVWIRKTNGRIRNTS
jgi:hypothetical protein